MSDQSCDGNDRLFYLNDDGKLEILYMQTNNCLLKTCIFLIECTKLNRNRKDANGLYVSIFFIDMGWYSGVMGKLHNYEYIIYIFTGEVINGNPNIFNKSPYHCWYK